ncbi:Aldo/keto reductase [Wolfiporia cocos MD-104 SS10]|uniref:Aldo/keto reductase n=1 Tax=Wolfiporia cocos (strain MD-104) TaxID=742152 RepID=A0A2H3JZ47_WOLCO|nr:Aldo/keto reductase [Wolfiporia cocos MD-104 SS10]
MVQEKSIPSIAFGTWMRGTGKQSIDYVDQAISVGFNHIDDTLRGTSYQDTAQAYMNEKENSLKNLSVECVDLYLIHHPHYAVSDIPTVRAKMEKIQTNGLAKSIGVSNFNVSQLEILLSSAKTKPAANRLWHRKILFHPHVLDTQAPIREYGNRHGIVSEAYSVIM